MVVEKVMHYGGGGVVWCEEVVWWFLQAVLMAALGLGDLLNKDFK